MLYTIGSFVKDPNSKYEGEDVYAYSGQDPDYWSYFEACDLIKRIDSEFNVTSEIKWKRSNTSHRCKKCLEYGHDSRTCKKNKQIVIVTYETCLHTQQKNPIHRPVRITKSKSHQRKGLGSEFLLWLCVHDNIYDDNFINHVYQDSNCIIDFGASYHVSSRCDSFSSYIAS